MRRICTLLTVAVLCLAVLLLPNAAAAQSGNVWQVVYFNNANWAGNPVFTQSTSFVSFNWGSDTPPGPFVPAQNWSARLTTSAFFYAGIYRFQIQADDDFALWIDNVLYADTRGAGVPGKAFTIDVPLTQGNHFVQVDYRQFTGPAYLFVNWSFAKGGNIQPNPPAPPPPAPPQPQPPAPGGQLVTDFGDYSRCMQQQIHQKNCFVSNGAWDAPNMGSIEMEPQIAIWERCTPGQVHNKRVVPNGPKVSVTCSKTQAGWFRN
jgi:hypothetical protein